MNDLPPSRLRAPLWLLGATAIGFGAWGSVFGADTDPVKTVLFVVGAALVHDLLLAPAVVAVAWWGRHLMPSRVQPWLGAGLLVSASLLVVAVPVLGRFGARSDDPSLLPKDYPLGLLVALAVVWVVVVIGATSSVRRKPPVP